MMPQDRVIYILVSCEIELGGHAFTELVRADVRVRESWLGCYPNQFYG